PALGSPRLRQIGHLPFQGGPPALEYGIGDDLDVLATVLRRLVEGGLPLDEGAIPVRDRQNADCREVVLDGKRGCFEVVGQGPIGVREGEKPLADAGAVLKLEAAYAADDVRVEAIFDLARDDCRVPAWQAVKVPHDRPDGLDRRIDDRACISFRHYVPP